RALPSPARERRLLELVAGAIRLHAHFLARHPSMLFQTLYNAGYWYDAEEAAPHYEPTESVRSARSLSSVRGGPKLSRLVVAFREQKRAAEPGFPWLRT